MRTLQWPFRVLMLLAVLAPLVLAAQGVTNEVAIGTAEAFAVQSNMSVLGDWEINANLFKGTLKIQIQGSDGGFGGFLEMKNEPRDAVSGKVEGPGAGPTRIEFTRTRPGAFKQVYVGAAAYGPPLGPDGRREEIIAGTFTHNGEGPYPWFATRIKVPK
jgi:hypothetical protein